MPIFEFRCLSCQELFEILQMGSSDSVETKCPKCGAETFERVMSSTNFAMGAGGGGKPAVAAQSRQCGGGSCHSWNLPGHSK
ncbi:MAG: zinc ribbon domain-containing protein [Pseudomonadota bacterium]